MFHVHSLHIANVLVGGEPSSFFVSVILSVGYAVESASEESPERVVLKTSVCINTRVYIEQYILCGKDDYGTITASQDLKYSQCRSCCAKARKECKQRKS